MKIRKIAVVTVGRSDFGIYRPLLHKIEADPRMELQLIASSAHFDCRFGETYREIEQDGFSISYRVECDPGGDCPQNISKSMGLALVGFGKAYAKLSPDIILVLGDRYEMHSAVSAAIPFSIPVAHIAGGAVSLGAIDDYFRHSMTKLSHLHFVEIEEYKDRLLRMGEEEGRIYVTGALGLDNIKNIPLLSLTAFNKKFGSSFSEPPILVTFHPVTREPGEAEKQMRELLAALSRLDRPVLITFPNADAEGRSLIKIIIEECDRAPDHFFAVPHLGTQGYYSAMGFSPCMVGNSSSGIVEAASFNLPVVNVGDRQKGRYSALNVIDCGNSQEDIVRAVSQAVDLEFRDSLKKIKNPYGEGKASEIMMGVLAEIELDRGFLNKEAP